MRSRGNSAPPTRAPSFGEHIRVTIRRSLSFTSRSSSTGTSSGGGSGGGNVMTMSNAVRDVILRCNLCIRRSFCHHGGRSKHFAPMMLLSCLVVLIIMARNLGPRPSSTVIRSGGLLLRGGRSGYTSSPMQQLVEGIKSSKLPSADLSSINAELSKMELDDVLLWAYEIYGNRLVDVTSFGYSGMVILHELNQLGLLKEVPVVTVDTLHLFPETYAFIDTVKERHYNMQHFHKYTPRDYPDRAGFDGAYGVDLWKEEPDRYNYLAKVEPTMRALGELDAAVWITGRRRDQGGERSEVQILEVDSSDKSRYKLNPLANWSHEDIWGFIHDHGIPYNPLHDRGYTSVGDYMTTAPVEKGAAERSGRFVGLGRTECGIHATRKKIKRMRQEAEKAGRDFEGTMSLPCPGCDFDVTPSTFDDIVLHGGSSNNNDDDVDGYRMLLLEFYSPLCGGCQEFAPKFKKIIKALAEAGVKNKIDVARYDITDHDVPNSGMDAGIEILATPDLYLVKRGDPVKIVHYDGEHEVEPVIQWLSQKAGLSVR
mmetsp:Transcript_19491/g.43367  ORF Transcript_19491/g.43367 Transcript_19491/m.43367 type:complete len:539 (+) Transcript_19491:105-1721(+)